MALLATENLAIHFGGVQALGGVDFSVEEHETVGLIGPNGSGKSTLLNCISGFYRPSDGVVRWRGRVLSKVPAYKVARLGIARTFQNVELFKSLTVRDNLVVATNTTGETRRRQFGEIGDLLGLTEHLDAIVGGLPLPAQKRVEIARALVMSPKLLLLDEPAAGCDDAELAALSVILRTIQGTMGIAVVLIEHHVEFVMALCQKVAVLNFGKRIAFGVPDAVRNDPAVIEAYLGTA